MVCEASLPRIDYLGAGKGEFVLCAMLYHLFDVLVHMRVVGGRITSWRAQIRFNKEVPQTFLVNVFRFIC